MAGSCPEWLFSHKAEKHFQLTHHHLTFPRRHEMWLSSIRTWNSACKFHTAMPVNIERIMEYTLQFIQRLKQRLGVRKQYLAHLRHWLWPPESQNGVGEDKHLPTSLCLSLFGCVNSPGSILLLPPLLNMVLPHCQTQNPPISSLVPLCVWFFFILMMPLSLDHALKT